MNKLIIKNVEIVDFSNTLNGDVYIEDGIIKEIGIEINKDCEVIDGMGKTLMPGFIDLHAHFREPGFEYKEDIKSGSGAAAKGGYTSVVLMANTKPAISNKKDYDYVIQRGKEIGITNIHQCVTVTKDMKGSSTEHLDSMLNIEGLKFISEDGKGVMDSKIMIEAMNKAKKKNIVVISHAESHDLSSVDMRLAENTMTWRDITLAQHTGTRLHMAHVSTKEAMNHIIDGKKNGVNLTCEVTPHHIALNSKTKYRVNPPLREEEDRLALIEGIKSGYVDCIGTDHAPHSEEDKIGGAPGMIGLEFSFTICNTKLVEDKHITINQLSYLMSKGPAKIMDDNSRGSIAIGKIADLVLIDRNRKIKLNKESIVSKSKNSPLIGFEGFGQVAMTMKNGKIVYKEGEF
ncbi:dihydroorotase [Clostridium frigidicarnis]|uniref:Dihydroorotase n=1 Tax=Clostridium frigidicarnis TaxID=84698 RepID=A0A1I1B5D2_9CLOT|nr:dihydroorotase [Clostridium frigidicarnis]SFB45574.1 dihydroorotase [Clostridium frigidicarnis]